MNLDNLTLGQIKEIKQLLGNQITSQGVGLLSDLIGKYVIIRTYSAGVWAGTLAEKDHNEVIITNARRLWRWQAAESISLSAVANFGINPSGSKIPGPVEKVWLEAIEIIPCAPKAQKQIEEAKNAEAQ